MGRTITRAFLSQQTPVANERPKCLDPSLMVQEICQIYDVEEFVISARDPTENREVIHLDGEECRGKELRSVSTILGATEPQGEHDVELFQRWNILPPYIHN